MLLHKNLNLKSELIIPSGIVFLYKLRTEYTYVIHSVASTCYLDLRCLPFYQFDTSKDALALDI